MIRRNKISGERLFYTVFGIASAVSSALALTEVSTFREGIVKTGRGTELQRSSALSSLTPYFTGVDSDNDGNLDYEINDGSGARIGVRRSNERRYDELRGEQ